ncbi:RecX family transcriptional regulator [Alkaliphilus peptidifermentans]|uniref:Regulatory protein RecX n=1 Tax=Alkaliphilus peptidifermentans DSM 18978 TaxID=1120976 RepID=A0A1G5KE13_9FIRM|nr:RecX family transcriptional regulator [Alkaliphilus peptidifermentans]SCY98873.1 regulatory protein [Alkaliphilus peptidifermentans DSM 18978]
MKVITNIQQQLKNKEYYNIFIDGNYSFSCNVEIIALHKLKVGLKVNEDELKEIVTANILKDSFNKALSYLTRKQRTKGETIKLLKEKGFDDSIISTTLEKLEYYKFIDDEKYTESFIKDHSNNKLHGLKKIQYNLKEKGIEDSLIKKNSSIYNEEDQLKNAVIIGKKFYLQNIKTPTNKLKEKLSAKLLSKGYSWDIIGNAINEIENDDDITYEISQNENVYEEEAKKLVEKYYTQYKKKEANPYILKNKVIAALYRKGYDSNLINKIIDSLK